LESKEKD